MDVDDAAPEQLARPALRTQQCTRNLQCPTTYFRLRIRGPRRPTAEQFVAAVAEALRQLHGLVGGALPVELLNFEPASGVGVVAVDRRHAQKLWPAVVLLTHLREQECTLEVLGSSPFLMSLANDSRAFCATLLADERQQAADTRGLG